MAGILLHTRTSRRATRLGGRKSVRTYSDALGWQRPSRRDGFSALLPGDG